MAAAMAVAGILTLAVLTMAIQHQAFAQAYGSSNDNNNKCCDNDQKKCCDNDQKKCCDDDQKKCCDDDHNKQKEVAIGGNGGSGGAGGAGGEGGNGGKNVADHQKAKVHQDANGGSANGGYGGSANGGNVCDKTKGHTYVGEVCGSS